jgi:Heterokaryon incompatibility protein (HET)
MKNVFLACLATGAFREIGNTQEIEWNDTHRRWSYFEWTIHKSTLDLRSHFGLFTLPGEHNNSNSIPVYTSKTNVVISDMPKPFSDFPVRNIIESTSSIESVAKVQKWIDKCCNTHTLCQPRSSNPTALPKRVLDVNPPLVKLYETRNEHDKYVCLSHCWGNSRPTCCTTFTTLEANKNGIAWHRLPATFRDAIDFTRRLGFRYIWIDSICIIQDNATDWAEQSALMAKIYENAYVTLCSTSSLNDDGGCYSYASSNSRPMRISAQKRDGTAYEVYVRQYLDGEHIPDWNRASRSWVRPQVPLMTRAWTFQERLLSPRLVHFTTEEIIWECSTLRDCFCFQDESKRGSPMFRLHSEKKLHLEALVAAGKSPKTLEHYWDTIVYAYSGLNLSLEKDKLPALSGVAKQMWSLRQGDEYLAGLWRKTILSDLRWVPIHGNSSRLHSWRGPSWSWVSLDGTVMVHYYDTEVRDYCKCVEASVTPLGLDPTGEISSGYIVLSAAVMLTTLQKSPTSQYPEDKFNLVAAGLETQFKPDCRTDLKNGNLNAGDILLCLRLGTCQYRQDLCLVLRRKGGDSSLPLYERVGIVEPKTSELEKHWFTAENENVLVKII